ncbi:glutaredoxin family protein [Salinicoccus sp. ID82-1]|uniref:Glutaredoxin family protein n=1 Tax=Salinicoccus cyprini TaxID=2493691 RepID=A0A558AV43_9STAP|nr:MULTISPECIES: glutaredoxin family protein [Salinicoccus]MCG1010485.1 glutaredoxin family protein [Salinicoccus sp. ID82-1]TVT28142.1 glutaredoxin family protein [Salinicoccus cyprini]
MNKKVNVVVWEEQDCPYCEEVKRYLTENGFEFRTIDVTGNEALREVLLIKYDVDHVPVVEIGFGKRFDAVTGMGISKLEKTLRHYRMSN